MDSVRIGRAGGPKLSGEIQAEASHPSYVGTEHPRFFTFEGNRLVLSTPPGREPADVTYIATWERQP